MQKQKIEVVNPDAIKFTKIIPTYEFLNEFEYVSDNGYHIYIYILYIYIYI